MKNKVLALFTLALPIAIIGFSSSPQVEPVAVIELFTSQGCSSCPPADRLLSKTISNANKEGKIIFALSFHVDYWNRLGWADPFSDKKYSQRQSEYASAMQLNSVYTPQMIVNGSTEFVGSSEKELEDALNKSLNTKPTVTFKTLTATIQNGNPPHVKYELDGNFSECKINFALASLNETTSVKRGENGGHILKSENVVRQFISIPATATGEIKFETTPVPASNNMVIVGYVQSNDLKIIGAAMVEIK
ncbi:MAG: DUF1223 domain-containing protein [Bacteroidota bacterium]